MWVKLVLKLFLCEFKCGELIVISVVIVLVVLIVLILFMVIDCIG